MFGIGFSELVLLGILGLVLIGPKDLPVLARSLGRFLNDLKQGADGFKDEFLSMKDQDDYRRHISSTPGVPSDRSTDKQSEESAKPSEGSQQSTAANNSGENKVTHEKVTHE